MRTVLLVALIVAFGAAGTHAQKATEMFIPIGESPGVSGEESVVGRIKSIDHEQRTITVVNDDGVHVFKIGDDTHIWVDRSKSKQKNRYGALSDCRKGKACEVKYDPAQPLEVADWVKVQN